MNSWHPLMPRIGPRRWALACGVLYLLGAFDKLETKAWAQAQRSDNPAPPGQSYATGDWGGVRSYLEGQGVTFTFSYTNDFLANASGGIKTGAAMIGIFQPQVDLDLQKLLGWEGDKIHIHGLITYGPPFSADYLGNILAVSNLEAGQVARLYALWYEHNAPNDLWSVRAGLLLGDSQFLQSSTAANFINNGISWPTFLAGNLPASGPASPASPRHSRAREAARRSGVPGRGVQRRSQRRQWLQSTGSASDRDDPQHSRRRLFHRRGELLTQSGQGRDRTSRRLPHRGVVPYQLAVLRSAL